MKITALNFHAEGKQVTLRAHCRAFPGEPARVNLIQCDIKPDGGVIRTLVKNGIGHYTVRHALRPWHLDRISNEVRRRIHEETT